MARRLGHRALLADAGLSARRDPRRAAPRAAGSTRGAVGGVDRRRRGAALRGGRGADAAEGRHHRPAALPPPREERRRIPHAGGRGALGRQLLEQEAGGRGSGGDSHGRRATSPRPPPRRRPALRFGGRASLWPAPLPRAGGARARVCARRGAMRLRVLRDVAALGERQALAHVGGRASGHCARRRRATRAVRGDHGRASREPRHLVRRPRRAEAGTAPGPRGWRR
mmetsp:Transcript_18960/g.61043  ORF Transcript_18960/g.61043 Transcript_18960/m.61043 type:complete len:226 (-) Transcript_18960:914-1591(-)